MKRAGGTTSRTTALLALLALVLLGCSASGSDDETGVVTVDPERRAAVERVMAAPPIMDPGPDVGGLSTQRAMLADYWVTFAEYEQAMRAAVGCIEDAGFTVNDFGRWPDHPGLMIAPGLDPTLYFAWSYPLQPDGSPISDVELSCRAQWSSWVEEVWQIQNTPTVEQQQAWLERAWACGREREVRMADPPTENDAVEAIYAGCRPWEVDG